MSESQLKSSEVFCENRLFDTVLRKDEEFSKLIEFFIQVLNTSTILNSEEDYKEDVRIHCFNSLTNLAKKASTSSRMLAHPNFVNTLTPYWFEEKNLNISKTALLVLRNLTHELESATKLVHSHAEFVTKAVLKIAEVKSIETESYENYAAFLCNATQTLEGRSIMMSQEKGLLPRVFVFLDHEKFSLTCRTAISGILKNCCMAIDSHDWLLSPEIDILSALLLPLAGPEEFTDEEYSKMPLDLQYLPSDKTREPDGNVRNTLLQSLMQLCLKRKSRETIRENNVYYILREYHLWEPSTEIQDYLEDLVNLIIRTEEEIGVDDFRNFDDGKLESS